MQGKLTKETEYLLLMRKGCKESQNVTKLYTSNGFSRYEVNEVTSGDIIAIAGISELTIGHTVRFENPVALPSIK